MLNSCGLPRDELVVTIEMEAIIALFYWKFYHGAHVMSKCRYHTIQREFQLDNFRLPFGTQYVGIKI